MIDNVANVLKDLNNAKNKYQNFLKKFPNHELAPSVNFELDNMGLSIEELQKKVNCNHP